MSLAKGIVDAREACTKLIELMQNPKVRNDSVVRALLKGLAPKKSDFAKASLTVSTLRDAGLIGQSTSNNSSSVSGGPKDQPKSGKKEKKKTSTTEKKDKPQKLRAIDRAINLLIEDDMAVKKATKGNLAPMDKKDHFIAKKLTELRADPDRKIEVKMIKSILDHGTYASGKEFVKFKEFVFTEVDGKTVPQIDELASGPRKVKDLSDWDLLALEAPELFKKGGFLRAEHLFEWADKDAKRKVLESSLANVDATWASLKGTSLIEMIKLLDFPINTNKRAEMHTELSKLPWAKFGPSTTLWWKGKKIPLPDNK